MSTSAPVTAASVISPPPIDEYHFSHNIHTERAQPTVEFNAAPSAAASASSSSNRFVLRRMDNSDDAVFTDTVRELFAEYIAGLGIDMTFQNASTELEELPGLKYIAKGNGALFVLEDTQPDLAKAAQSSDATATAVASSSPSTVLAGCIALKDLGDGIAEAKRLFTRPAYRGLDFGRLLLVHIIDIAAQAGYDKIRLDTLARFTAANKLYASLGFRRIDPYNFNPQSDVLYFELDGLPTREYVKGREEQYASKPRRATPIERQ